MSLYNNLLEFAKKENIIAGVGSAVPFYELKAILENTEVPFVSYSIKERTEPAITMSGAKSIVAIGLSYNVVYTKIKDNKLRGNMSAGAVGIDYHIIVKEKLQKLKNEIIPNSEVKIFVDTGPLSDRAVALRCGLGTRGKNGSIINSKIGGMFFIGYMLTDVDYENWQRKEGKYIYCGDCDRCIKACPNNAINNGVCDYKKCIAYLSQKKGELTYEEYKSMGKQIYGCDICQRVCPYNSSSIAVENERAYPDIEELLTMSNKEFKSVYGNTAAGWRGKKTLQRNALIALGNMKSKNALTLVEKFLYNESIELKMAAEYAFNKIKES